jgi:hypothetical protein
LKDILPTRPMSDESLAHESVHQGQSQVLGPFYLPAILTSYAMGVGDYIGTGAFFWGVDPVTYIHDASPMEVMADLFSGKEKNIKGNLALQRYTGILKWLTTW